MEDEKITVTVSGDADVVAQELRAAGMSVDQVLGAAGVVTGSVAAGKRASLADLSGVASVEAEHTFQIAPPDAEVQ
jgi:hypothetical protein